MFCQDNWLDHWMFMMFLCGYSFDWVQQRGQSKFLMSGYAFKEQRLSDTQRVWHPLAKLAYILLRYWRNRQKMF